MATIYCGRTYVSSHSVRTTNKYVGIGYCIVLVRNVGTICKSDAIQNKLQEDQIIRSELSCFIVEFFAQWSAEYSPKEEFDYIGGLIFRLFHQAS